MERHCENASVIPSERLFIESFTLFPLPGCFFLKSVIQNYIGNNGTDSHLDCSLPCKGKMPVLVIERHSACPDHFEGGHFRSPIHEITIDSGFDVPDSFNPCTERHIFFDSSHERHCSMRMHIYESRHRRTSCTVKDLHAGSDAAVISATLFTCRKNLPDAVSFDENIAPDTTAGYVFQ